MTEILTLATHAGIIATTWSTMQWIVKPLIPTGSKAARVPVALWVTGLACGFAAISRASGLMDGSWSTVLGTAFTLALGSIGTHEVLMGTAKQGVDSDNGSTGSAGGAKIPLSLLPLAGLLALFVAALSGCSATPAFVSGVQATWEPIAPEYRSYVEADSRLTADEKTLRLGTADVMDQLILAERSRYATPAK